LNLTDQKVVRSKNFIFRQIVEEMVLVPIRQNVADLDSIFTLNELGAFIWGKLEVPDPTRRLKKQFRRTLTLMSKL